MWQLFLLVVSLTSVSFGGAQLLLAGLERELVQTGRMGSHDFAAAVALGQSTPGPLAALTTAIGMKLGGVPGAVVATSALIVVSLVVVWLIQQVPASVLQHRWIRTGLGGLPTLSVALMTFLAVQMLRNLGGTTLLGAVVIGGVLIGKLYKMPTGYLMVGAILISVIGVR